MNTASLIKKISIVVAAFAVLVSYQNCSKVQPSVLMQDVGGHSVGPEGTLVGDSANDLVVEEEDGLITPVEPTDISNGEQGGVDTWVEVDVVKNDDPKKDDPKKDDVKQDDVKQDDVKRDDPKDELEVNDTVTSIAAECAKAKKSAVAASGDIRISNGANYIKANSLGKVTGPGHGSGKLYIMANTAASVTIASIKGVGGKVVLCNAIVGEISDTNGNIRLYKTSVGAASDHDGKYFVYGTSTIQDVSGLKKSQIAYVP